MANIVLYIKMHAEALAPLVFEHFRGSLSSCTSGQEGQIAAASFQFFPFREG